MRDSHLSIETLARLLAGDLDHESLTQEVVPHLLQRCNSCRKRYEEILELQRTVGHWDERVAVFEGLQAPDLFELLEALPFDEQLRRVLEDESFQTWGFCQLLIRKSLDQVLQEPSRAVQMAELAVRVGERLGDAYDPHWVRDLQARAYIHLGNARRVLGEQHGAEMSFLEAERLLAGSMTGNIQGRAEWFYYKASLRRDQRRFAEALELSERAIELYREIDDLKSVACVLLNRAYAEQEAGEADLAVETLRTAAESLGQENESRSKLCILHNLALLLVDQRRFDEARDLLPKVEDFCRRHGQPLDHIRLAWMGGRLSYGLGQIESAEATFRTVQQQFTQRGMAYDAALVLLDLAVLLADEGRFQELKILSNELRTTFKTLSIPREALAAFLLFEQACREERATAQLARQLVALFGKGPRERPL